jgi:arsenate reductase-like glutaredoxin family protein
VNIQIFGTKKSSDTRKAERFFKERGIKFQSIDLKENDVETDLSRLQGILFKRVPLNSYKERGNRP